MLVLDSGTQQDWREASKREGQNASRQENLLKEIWSNSITVKDDAGWDTSNLLSQMGRPMSSVEVERRLKLICPRIIFERSLSDDSKVGLYIETDEKNAAGGWQKRKTFLCGMESGILPEFSVLHKTKKQIANPELFGKEKRTRDIDWLNVDTVASETRGWRTVLVRLMHLGIITRGDVQKHFAWTPSRDSAKWQEQTR
jgi:hypothetical protein